jgi:hypothetical protein
LGNHPEVVRGMFEKRKVDVDADEDSESEADSDDDDDDGNTALVRAHKAEMVKLLFAAAPSALNHRNAKSREPLSFTAVNAGDIGALEEVFKYTDSDGVPVNVNHKDINGDTALHMAVMVGNVAGVKLLLAKGADASAVGLDSMTVFMRAVDLKQYWQYNIEFHYFLVQATMDKGFHASRIDRAPLSWAITICFSAIHPGALLHCAKIRVSLYSDIFYYR